MACRPTLQSRLLLGAGRRNQPAATCLFCALVPRARRRRGRRDASTPRRRWHSTATDARAELEDALLALQRQAPGLLDPARLPLALRGLRQPPGDEAVRVAILSVSAGDGGAATAARRLVGTLLADPLQEEQAWERALAAEEEDAGAPLVVRVGPTGDARRGGVDMDVSSTHNGALRELRVSSPELNGLHLELLLAPAAAPHGAVSVASLQEAVLGPQVAVPGASPGSVPTPVHRALLVADGLAGAARVASLPMAAAGDAVRAAVHMDGLAAQPLGAALDVVDVAQAEAAVRLFRQGPQHAMDYERLWSASNLPAVMAWLRAAAETTAAGATRPAVRQLVASLLGNARGSIPAADGHKTKPSLAADADSPALGILNAALADWAQRAHAELQDELDLAFTGRRWRQLGWWKLFWRVDDVAMLTSDMLSQRFLPTAEHELVYLTGRIAQLAYDAPPYPQPASSRDGEARAVKERHVGPAQDVVATASSGLPKWPGHIAFTRRYLQDETVPALQSLAQKLVMESLGTSAATTSLAALLYVSSFATTLYEAGAVAALGIVYSLGRMQKRWETARSFWEGEVREEGRKAVRGAEASVAAVLDNGASNSAAGHGAAELQETRDLVARAEEALARMK